jgi:RimJ/RimL family protein N-acetyltransferase
MRLDWNDSENVAAWVAARIPQMSGSADFGPCRAVGVVSSDGQPLGGVVFHNYQARFRNIEVSFASESPRWLTRRLIKNILTYPFGQLDCQRITALTPRKAASARRFLDVFGFKREGLLRKGFGTDDMVISGLLQREWLGSKWVDPANRLKGSHGQSRSNSAASSGPERRGCGADGQQRSDGELSVPA